MDGNKVCGGYVGIACVDGSCPIANADQYEEYGMDAVRRCTDCAMYGTEYCKSPLEEKP